MVYRRHKTLQILRVPGVEWAQEMLFTSLPSLLPKSYNVYNILIYVKGGISRSRSES